MCDQSKTLFSAQSPTEASNGYDGFRFGMDSSGVIAPQVIGAIPRARFKILLQEAQQWFVSMLVVRLPYFIAIFVSGRPPWTQLILVLSCEPLTDHCHRVEG
jgi:hypothetical protein